MSETQRQEVGEYTSGKEGARFSRVSQHPDPEVIAQPKRRNYTVAYKLKVIETVASLREGERGDVGSYLRKEGLYYSNVRQWTRLHEQGKLTVSTQGRKEKDRASAIKSRDVLATENKKLRRKLEQTEKRLAKTEMIVELQKKLSAIWDLEKEELNEKDDAQ
jgi:transposase